MVSEFYISPSRLTMFNRCKREFVFEYGLFGIEKEEEVNKALEIGLRFHKGLEDYYNLNLDKIDEGEFQYSEVLKLVQDLYCVRNEVQTHPLCLLKREDATDYGLKLEIGGLPIVGFIDVLHSEGVLDWKTCSRASLAKHPVQIKNDYAMLIYAWGFFELNPDKDICLMSHVNYIKTNPKLSFRSDVEVTRKEVEGWVKNTLTPLAKQLWRAYREYPETVEATPRSCFRFGRLCVFAKECSR